MKKGLSLFCLFLVVSTPLSVFGQDHVSIGTKNFIHPINNKIFSYNQDKEILNESWHQLSEVIFWRKVIRTSPDSIIINLAGSRQILDVVHKRDWYKKTYQDRRQHLHMIKNRKGLRGLVLFTHGKNNYYQIQKVIPQLPDAFDIFQQEDVDPWYAQSILLIESPGSLRMSPSGAYGPFQLMRKIAIKYGLVVNRRVDERADLKKSARAAAQLLRISCIPEAEMVLRRVGIRPDKNSLWFRLIVLHIYHAGTGNVQAALQCVSNRQGGQVLLKKLWRVRCKDFQSASRNYSQIALAANLELQKMVQEEYQTLRQESNYKYLRLLSAF